MQPATCNQRGDPFIYKCYIYRIAVNPCDIPHRSALCSGSGMPALLSKEASKDEDAALVERERQIKLLFMHVSINMFVSILNFTTRTEMLNSLTGDFERTSVIMANWTGGTALLEFLLNPTLGALSDKYGRRPFMVMAPWASLVLKSWVFMNPTILSLSVEKIVCDAIYRLRLPQSVARIAYGPHRLRPASPTVPCPMALCSIYARRPSLTLRRLCD